MKKVKVLILQCDNGDENSNLIASARHLYHQSKLIYGEKTNLPLHIIFIIKLKRVAHGCQNLGSFHGVNWRCVHIDELRPSSDELPSLIPYANQKMSYIFERFGCGDSSIQEEDDLMETGLAKGSNEDSMGPGSIEKSMDVDSPVMTVNKESIEAIDNEIEMEFDSEINTGIAGHPAGSPEAPMEVDPKASYDGIHRSTDDVNSTINVEKAREEERKMLLGILRRCVQSSIVQTVTGSCEGGRLTTRIHLLLELLTPHYRGLRKIRAISYS